MPVAAGQTFGNFKVVRLLGEGGFGEVYEAENPFLQRRAAVKVLHKGMGNDPELVRRFLNEARAASSIRHPGIIEVFDAGVTADGEPYLLMEFLEGDSLQRRLLRDERLEVRQIQEILRQVGSALSAAHGLGIVHRDLKPENIFLTPDPSSSFGFRVKVLDFGIAKIKHRDESGTIKTQAGILMGSPTYMSPEQCRDSADVDHRSDIYALGIIAYEMLAGLPPFVSKSTTEMLVLQITADPRPLREHRPDLPEHLHLAVMRALSKDRQHRFESVDSFVGAVLGNSPAVTTQDGTSKDGGLGIATVLPSPARAVPLPARILPDTQPAFSTMTRATGEIATARADEEAPAGSKSKMWRLAVAALIVIGIGGTAYFGLARSRIVDASGRSAAKAHEAHVRILSIPAGATVLDSGKGESLGKTPLDLVQPQNPEPLLVTLRLAGFKDKVVQVAREANSSTQVELEAQPAEANPPEAKTPEPRPAADSPARKKAGKTGKKVIKDSEEEWRLH